MKMKRGVAIGLAAMVVVGLGVSGGVSTALLRPARADETSAPSGLALPKTDSQRGRLLYVSKGCVGCHAMNEVGGTAALPLDAATMDPAGDPFEFFARVWLGMKPMIEMQESKMGAQVELSAQELADIVAFIHDPAMQKTFSMAEVPDNIEDLMDE